MREPELTTPRVTLNIFSGLRNPSWGMSPATFHEFGERLKRLPKANMSTKPYDAWSFYAGYTIEWANGRAHTLTVFNEQVVEESGDAGDDRVEQLDPGRQLEAWLFTTMPAELTRVLDDKSFTALSAERNENKTIAGIAGAAAGFGCGSAPPFPGASGVWRTRKRHNNCYNYANNEPSTGSLSAMPGGLTVTSFTPASLRSAIVSDGLVDLGVTLPPACPAPPNAHYIAVCLRKKYGVFHDFHCLRLDANGGWSHKDGNSLVKNTDNSGTVLTDLSTARWKLASSLVGFFLSVSGQRNIRA